MSGEVDNPAKLPGRSPIEAHSDGTRRTVPASVISWREQAQRVQTQAHFAYLAFKHPRTPWYAKLVAACTAGYLLSPIQLIPSFIPLIGFLDDLLVLFLGVKLLQKITPPDVILECRQHAEDAWARTSDKFRSPAAAIAAIAVAAVWLLTAVAANGLMAAYIRR